MANKAVHLPRVLFKSPLLSGCPRRGRPIPESLLFPSGRVPFGRRWSSYAVTQESSSSKINAPTTLPPPLELPPWPKNSNGVESWRAVSASFLFKYGKGHLVFFKNGLKNVIKNSRQAREIMARVRKEVKGGTILDGAREGALARSEFQILHRSWHDLKRLPIFAVVFLIFGEFTPLVVVFMSSVVPGTCRVPKQVLGDRTKLEARRKESFRNLTIPPPTGSEVPLEILDRKQLLHISTSLGLHSKVWPEQMGLPPVAWLLRKLRRRMSYLEQDDALIQRDGGVSAMDIEEVKIALVERGVDILGKPDDKLRAALRSWLWAQAKSPLPTLFLTRPSAWKVRDPR